MSKRKLIFFFASALSAWAVSAGPAAASSTVRIQVVGPNGEPVEDAAMYLQPSGDQKTVPRVPQPAAIAQRNREFVPHLTVIQTGAAVSFPNKDPVQHHVYSFSKAKRFEIKLYAGDGPEPIVFDQPGVVTIGCNVHDWMLGYVVVVDTPWFGKTDTGGLAQIEGVDDGEYEVRLWHPRQRHEVAPQHLKLPGGSAEQLRFVVEVAARKPRYKPPLDPLHYSS
jgi:plastocyanin